MHTYINLGSKTLVFQKPSEMPCKTQHGMSALRFYSACPSPFPVSYVRPIDLPFSNNTFVKFIRLIQLSDILVSYIRVRLALSYTARREYHNNNVSIYSCSARVCTDVVRYGAVDTIRRYIQNPGTLETLKERKYLTTRTYV